MGQAICVIQYLNRSVYSCIRDASNINLLYFFFKSHYGYVIILRKILLAFALTKIKISQTSIRITPNLLKLSTYEL